MVGALTYIGSEPHLVGLATLGGLIGLAVFCVSACAWVYGRHVAVRSLRARKRLASARNIAKGFRLARRGRLLGVSTLGIVAPDLRAAMTNVAAMTINFATMIMNASFAVTGPINGLAVVLNLLVIFGLTLGTLKIVDRAVARVRYADSPALFWPDAKRHIRVARKKRR